MKLLNDTLVPHWRALLDFYVMKGILYLSLIKLYHTFSLLSMCQYSRNSKRVFVHISQQLYSNRRENSTHIKTRSCDRVFGILVVFCVNFKIALGMCAGGAHFGCLGAHNDVSAVAAFPYLYFALFKYLSCFYIL